jgi:tetratricopeptide (TPR) repeat protein
MGEPRRRRSLWLLLFLVILIIVGGGLFTFARLRGRAVVLYNKGILYRRSGNTAAAVASFKAALARDPRYRDARVGLMYALASQRDFEGAEAELKKAEETGLEEPEAALMRARLLSLHAAYRLQSAGQGADVALCDSVIGEQVAPAIKLVEDHAEQTKNKAEAYNELGNLYMQKSKVLAGKWGMLRDAEATARHLDRKEEAADKKALALAVLPQMAEAQRNAVNAYGRAMELDPQMEEPRLEIAHHALAAFVPKPDRVKQVLAPIIAAKPHHRAARELLAGAATLAGDYDGALAHIKAARQEGREDFDLLLAEAAVLVEAKRWEQARPLCERLGQLQPNDPRSAYLRAKVLLQDGRAAEAVSQLQNILGRQPSPQARFLLAKGLRDLGNREQATAAFQQFLQEASDQVPGNVRQAAELREMQYESHLALAEYLKGDDPKSAAEHAVAALALFPNRPEAFQAAKEARQAAKLPPEGMEDLVLIHAAGFLAKGNLDGALAFCQLEVDQAGTPTWGPQVRLLIARMLARKGSFKEAVAAYENLRATSADKRPAYELAVLQARLGQLDSARKIYEGLLASQPKDVRALVGLVSVLARTGQMAEARALLVRAEKELGSPVIRSILLNSYLSEGKLEEATALARALVEAEPANASTHNLLAEMLWRGGKLAEARDAFDEALKLAPDQVPAYRRGLLDLQDGRTPAALELFRDARQRFPRYLAFSTHFAVALQAAGQEEEASQVLGKALADPATPEAAKDGLHWCLAVLCAGMGKAEEAKAHDQQVRQSELGPQEDREELLERLAAAQQPGRQQAAAALNLLVSFSGAGCPEAALQSAEVVQKLMPGEPLPPCWHALLLDRQGKHQDAVAAYEANIRDHPDSVFARALLAESHAGHDDAESAIRVFEEAIPHASDRQTALMHLRLGRLYDGQGRIEMAIASYEAAMKEPALAPVACNNLAYLVATRKGDPIAALPLAEQAFKLGRGSPEIADTLGWVHSLKGNTDEAVKYLELARKGLPGIPTVRYHLAVAYQKAGRTAEAKAELEEALLISRTFPEADEAAKLLQTL